MPTPEDLEKRKVEGHKLAFDLFKHLTTLSSGSVLVLAVMLDRAFPGAAHRWLVGVAVAAFMANVGCSVVVMLVAAAELLAAGQPPAKGRDYTVSMMAGAGVTFGVGVAALVVFVFVNLRGSP